MFTCDGNNNYKIPTADTFGMSEERLVQFRCQCDWQPPPDPSLPFPTLYQCWYEYKRPKWHVYTSAILWHPTTCSVNPPDDRNGDLNSLACLKNKFLKTGDQIVMCYGKSAYDGLDPDERNEIDTNWSIESKPADSRCMDTDPHQPFNKYPYWILTKK